VFTATVIRNGLTVTNTTSTLSISKINAGFTATLFQNVLTVNENTQTVVNINTQPASVFTGTVIDQTVNVSQIAFAVTATNAVSTVTVAQNLSPVSITYNPTIVNHLFDGQPVYTTSSVQFKQLTLGNTSTFTFPADDGFNGAILITDGAGQLYWGGGGGGGGGLVTWNLNSDLVTNGFKIKSNSTAVDLTILGGMGQIKLDTTSTRISHTGTGQIIISAPTTTLISNTINQGDLTVNGNLYISGGINSIVTSTNDLYVRDLFGRNITASGGISAASVGANSFYASGDLSAAVVTGRSSVATPSITAPSGTLSVPTLRFPDGSELYSAYTATIILSTTTIDLSGPLYTNNNQIKSNNSVGTLDLTQGLSRIRLSNTGTDSTIDIRSQKIDIVSSGTATLTAADDLTLTAADSLTLNSSGKLTINAGPEIDINTTRVNTNIFRAGYWFEFADGTTTSTNNRNLDSLSDVQITNPTFGQVLKYDGTRWYNGSDSGDGTTSSGVDSIIAGPGISVNSAYGDVTITNTGIRTVTASNGLAVSVSSSTASFTIGNLPIQRSGANAGVLVDTSTYGTTKLSLDYNEVFNNIQAGYGIRLDRNFGGNGTLVITSTATDLSSDLLTNGYNINGGANALTIKAGLTNVGITTATERISRIYMPQSQPMQLFSDYGITIDTPDDTVVQILSPFTVSHRNGDSRISTDAQGLTRFNDTIIAMTATTRIVMNKSFIQSDRVVLQSDSGIGKLIITDTTTTVEGRVINLASTSTVKIGSDLYNSKVAVQTIVNYNDTGAPTFSRGIQFADLSVQTTAYQGFLNFGILGAPATNPQDFFLQLTAIDFGTITQPSAFAYDAGTLE
jgi:hypothetical protein